MTIDKVEHTERGFAHRDFLDHNGTPCIVQKSSLADEDCIWLGAKEIGLKQFIPSVGWHDVPLPGRPDGINYIANNRMHLSREEVEKLIPILQMFVNTGEIE